MAEKMYNRGTFKFVGEPVWGRSNVLTTEKLKNSIYNKTRLNFGVKVENNAQFLSTEYIFENQEKIRLFDKDSIGFDVNWNETTSIENLNKLKPASLMTINLETDQEVKNNYYSTLFKRINHEKKKIQTDDDKKKIAEYTEELKKYSNNVHVVGHIKDLIDVVMKHKELISQYDVKISGGVKSNFYKNENRLQYIPKTIELLEKGSTEKELTINMDLFFTKEGIEDDETEQKMVVGGYIGEYIKKQDKLIPTSVVFDYSKADLEKEEHKNLVDFIKGFFKVDSKDEVYRLPLICSVINGSEVVEFDESLLTDQQKMAIKLGMNILDDFKPKGNTYGDRVSYIKLKQPDLKQATEGAIEMFSIDELDSYLTISDEDTSSKDLKKEDIKEDDKKTDQDKLINNLFGI